MILTTKLICVLSGSIPTNSSTFGEGTGLIVLSNLQCNGDELLLRNCPSGGAMSCSHSDDAGVRCQFRTGITTDNA